MGDKKENKTPDKELVDILTTTYLDNSYYKSLVEKDLAGIVCKITIDPDTCLCKSYSFLVRANRIFVVRITKDYEIEDLTDDAEPYKGQVIALIKRLTCKHMQELHLQAVDEYNKKIHYANNMYEDIMSYMGRNATTIWANKQ